MMRGSTAGPTSWPTRPPGGGSLIAVDDLIIGSHVPDGDVTTEPATGTLTANQVDVLVRKNLKVGVTSKPEFRLSEGDW